jgi:CheY-like chemotaxis protein
MMLAGFSVTRPWGDAMKQEFKILLLETAECSADLVEYELGKASRSFTVMRVEDHESFIRALQEFCPNLILADCLLKYSDGLIALAQAQEICPETPFLFVSGNASPALLNLDAAGSVRKTSQIRVWPKIKSYFQVTYPEPKTC